MAGKTEYKNNWQKENVDRVNLTMPKGRKAIIQTAAAAAGESVNSYINGAIDDRMVQEAATALSIEGTVSLPPEALKAAQEAAEAAGEATPVFVARAIETQAQRDALARKMEGGKTDE